MSKYSDIPAGFDIEPSATATESTDIPAGFQVEGAPPADEVNDIPEGFVVEGAAPAAPAVEPAQQGNELERYFNMFKTRQAMEGQIAEQAAAAQQEQAAAAQAKDLDPNNWSSERFRKEAPKPRTIEEKALYDAFLEKKLKQESSLKELLLKTAGKTWEQVYDKPAAGIREGIRSAQAGEGFQKGYEKGIADPKQIEMFQNEFLQKANAGQSSEDMIAASKAIANAAFGPIGGAAFDHLTSDEDKDTFARFLVNTPASTLGLAADIVTNPADLLITILGDRALKYIGKIPTGTRTLGERATGPITEFFKGAPKTEVTPPAAVPGAGTTTQGEKAPEIKIEGPTPEAAAQPEVNAAMQAAEEKRAMRAQKRKDQIMADLENKIYNREPLPENVSPEFVDEAKANVLRKLDQEQTANGKLLNKQKLVRSELIKEPAIAKDYERYLPKNLAGDEAAEADFIKKNYRKSVLAYRKEIMREYGSPNVVSSDVAKTMPIEGRPKFEPSHSAARHEASSALAKVMYDEMLADPNNSGKDVLLLSGVSGAGKTTALKEAGIPLNDYIVVDSNMSNASSAQRYINKALESNPNRQIVVANVSRDPMTAFKQGVYKRFVEKPEHRVVPVDVHLQNYKSQSALEQIVANNQDNPRVSFSVYDNNGPRGSSVRVPFDKRPKYEYTPTQIRDEALNFLKAERERAQGIANHPLTEEAYQTFVRPVGTEGVAETALDRTFKSGGATIHPVTGNEPKSGYGYAVSKEHEVIVPKAATTLADVEKYIQSKKDVFGDENLHLGMWADEDGNIYFDISKVTPDKEAALADAASTGQKAIYDFQTGESIPVEGKPNVGPKENKNILGQPTHGNEGAIATGGGPSEQGRTGTPGSEGKAPSPGSTVEGGPNLRKEEVSRTPGERYAGNINLDRLQTTEEAERVIKETASLYKSKIAEQTRGVMSHEETQDFAKSLGLTAEKLQNMRKGGALNAEQLVAARDILKDQTNKVLELHKRIMNGENSDDVLEEFRRQIVAQANVQKAVSGATAESGRALSAQRIIASEERAAAISAKLQRRQALRQESLDSLIKKATRGIRNQKGAVGNLGPADEEALAAQVELARRAGKGGVETLVKLGIERGAAEQIMAAAATATKEGGQFTQKKLVESLGDREITQEIANRMAKLDLSDPVAVNKFIRDTAKAKTSDQVYFYFINSILSNPLTHIVNTTSNLARSVANPIYRAAGAALEAPGAAFGRKPSIYLGEAGAEAVGKARGVIEGARRFLFTMRNGVTEEQITKFDTRPVPIKGPVGTAVSVPTRALTAEDEFFKAINGQGEIYAQAYNAAKKAPKGEFWKTFGELVKNPTPDMEEAAIKAAERQTFQDPLGKAGQEYIRFRNRTPLKWFTPFVKTPVNIFKDAIRTSPAGFAMAAKEEAVPKSLTVGQAAVGSAAALFFAGKAMEGKITGAAPKDEAARKRFFAEGKRPYAFKVGNRWVEYRRIEPFATVLGLIGDGYRLYQEKDLSEANVGEIASEAIKLIGNNALEKTFMSSLMNLANAIEDPQKYGERFLSSYASAAVPFSGAVRATANVMDDTLREPKGIVEQIKSGLPGLSQTLRPKLDQFGQPVQKIGKVERALSPMQSQVESKDPIINEMSRLNITVPVPGKRQGGVKLTDEEYFNFVKRTGEKTKERLERFINAPNYQYLSDEVKKRIIEKYLKSDKAQPKEIEKAAGQRVYEKYLLELAGKEDRKAKEDYIVHLVERGKISAKIAKRLKREGNL